MCEWVIKSSNNRLHVLHRVGIKKLTYCRLTYCVSSRERLDSWAACINDIEVSKDCRLLLVAESVKEGNCLGNSVAVRDLPDPKVSLNSAESEDAEGHEAGLPCPPDEICLA